MKVEKRIIAMIMAMYIGTSNALAQPVSGEKIGEAPINYSYTTARAKTQNGIVIKNVNLRTKPNKTTSKIIRTLKVGEKVIIVGKSGNYYKIEYASGKFAYAYANNYIKIEEAKPNDKPDVKLDNNVGISTANVNVRTSPNSNIATNKIGKLLKGTKVEVVGQSGDFYKIKYQGQYAYASKYYISVTKGLKLDKISEIKLTQDTVVRELASENSNQIAKLQEGTTVNVIERLFNGWYKIEINNVYGYIKPTDGNLVSSDKDINLMKEDGYYYYINPDGTKYKGYKVVDGIQYYFSDETGESIDQFAVVREKENGKTVTNRYFVKENGGVLKNTFRSIPELNDKLYYFGADGKAVRGINTINGKKYYFNTRYSYIMTGLCSVNENIYYFNKSNYTMETNTTKIVAGKLKLDIGSDGRVYNMTKLDDSDLANMLYSGFSKMGTVYSHNYEEGLDCSNYVSEILREIGLNTFSKDERTSQQQAIYCEQNNLTVSKKNLQPGDILFYNNTNCSNIKKYGHCSRALENGMHVHHVAIYIGDGKIMESTSGVNKDYEHAGVRIYNLSQSSTYYVYSAARVLGIKRPVTPENPDIPENPDTPENPDNKGDQENNNQTNKDDRMDNGNIENNDVKNEE